MTIKSQIDKYCKEVLSGKIIAGEYQKLAIKRYQNDLKTAKKRGLYFDQKAAERPILFFSFLKHSKGIFAGKPFELLPWQMFIIWNLFGWKHHANPKLEILEGTRRFNHAYIEIARKNGKSTLMAGLALYLLDADGERAADVYCFANKEQQARDMVFREAQNMVRQSPDLNNRLTVFVKSIFNDDPRSLSSFKPLGSDSNTQDGFNPSGAIGDEYHAAKTDEMVNVIKSGMGARQNPLMLLITTAGFNINGPCYLERETCIKILKGQLEQDNKFAMIFTQDEDDDWNDKKTWFKSNPSMNAIPTLKKFLNDEYKDAKNQPSKENNFKTKNLNIWTAEQEVWIPDDIWMRCNYSPITIESCKGRPCILAIDLAKRVDLNFALWFFTDKRPYDIYCRAWICDWKVENAKDRVDYRLWERQGFLTILPGEAVDLMEVAEQIYHDSLNFDLRLTVLDTAYMEFGVGPILRDKYNMELFSFAQRSYTMSPPTLELESLVHNGDINHGGNPILRWMNENVVIFTDSSGNIKISKGKSRKKVDGMVCLTMALGAMMAQDGQKDFDKYIQNVGI